jgi:hypothetical protein
MPTSPKASSEKQQLTDRVEQLESEIENLKQRLNDQTEIEKLVKRVVNCEYLAGIVSSGIKEE